MAFLAYSSEPSTAGDSGFRLSVGLLPFSCGRRDAQLSDQIVGTWYYDHPTKHGSMTFDRDGSYSASWGDQRQTNSWIAKWQVRHGVLLATSLKSNDVPVTGITMSRVVELEPRLFIADINDGGTNVITRSFYR